MGIYRYGYMREQVVFWSEQVGKSYLFGKNDLLAV